MLLTRLTVGHNAVTFHAVVVVLWINRELLIVLYISNHSVLIFGYCQMIVNLNLMRLVRCAFSLSSFLSVRPPQDWFSRQQLVMLVLIVNIALGIMFFKMLT